MIYFLFLRNKEIKSSRITPHSKFTHAYNPFKLENSKVSSFLSTGSEVAEISPFLPFGLSSHQLKRNVFLLGRSSHQSRDEQFIGGRKYPETNASSLMVAVVLNFIRIAKRNFLEKSFKEDPALKQPVFLLVCSSHCLVAPQFKF